MPDQKPKDKNKLYSLHAPEVECISKGKSRQPYEFGVKVTVATTHREGLVVGMRSLPGNPFDGHTLAEALEQVEILTEQKPKAVFVDKGYRGAEVPGIKVWRSGMRRGVTRRLKQDIKRRSAIEPMIGHMKNEGLLRRYWLHGSLLHAVLCGAGHNLRMILRKLRLLRRPDSSATDYLIGAPDQPERSFRAGRIRAVMNCSGQTTYDQIAARDKTSLDIFWLKDKSLADLDNLPEPDELADEIIENIEAGLASFRAIAAALQ